MYIIKEIRYMNSIQIGQIKRKDTFLLLLLFGMV